MSNNNPQQKSNIAAAINRLEKAVGALDKAVEKQLAGSGKDSPDVDALRAENKTLKVATETATARLDVAIDRLKTVLEA